MFPDINPLLVDYFGIAFPLRPFVEVYKAYDHHVWRSDEPKGGMWTLHYKALEGKWVLMHGITVKRVWSGEEAFLLGVWGVMGFPKIYEPNLAS